MTDLERLWLVHETLIETNYLPRRAGKTYYECHVLCGYLEVLENETIVVLVYEANRIGSFMRVLEPVLDEHNIVIDKWDAGSRRLLFKNNTNMVKFLTLSTATKGHICDYGADPYLNPIEDLD